MALNLAFYTCQGLGVRSQKKWKEAPKMREHEREHENEENVSFRSLLARWIVNARRPMCTDGRKNGDRKFAQVTH